MAEVKFTTFPIVLPARAELRIPIPDDPAREPVLLGRPGVIAMRRDGDVIVLKNTTSETVGATLVLAPAMLVKLGKVPWRDLARAGASYLEKFMADLQTVKPPPKP